MTPHAAFHIYRVGLVYLRPARLGDNRSRETWNLITAVSVMVVVVGGGGGRGSGGGSGGGGGRGGGGGVIYSHMTDAWRRSKREGKSAEHTNPSKRKKLDEAQSPPDMGKSGSAAGPPPGMGNSGCAAGSLHGRNMGVDGTRATNTAKLAGTFIVLPLRLECAGIYLSSLPPM